MSLVYPTTWAIWFLVSCFTCRVRQWGTWALKPGTCWKYKILSNNISYWHQLSRPNMCNFICMTDVAYGSFQCQMRRQERKPKEMLYKKKKVEDFKRKQIFHLVIIGAGWQRPPGRWFNCHQELSSVEKPTNHPPTSLFIFFIGLLLGHWLARYLIVQEVIISRRNDYFFMGSNTDGEKSFRTNSICNSV